VWGCPGPRCGAPGVGPRLAGQSFQIPEGAKHDACTTGGMKVLAVYIVEKGKPLATPAP
jgi:hypothetical protein